MTAIVRNATIIVGLVAAIAIVSHAQGRDVRREKPGTASVAGVVVAAEAAKSPLRRARVIVEGGSLTSPRIAVTDDEGRFVMSGLSAGQYRVSADKTGYLRMNYGATRSGRLGTSVVLADGERATGLSISLPRGAVIAGRVTNSDGEPQSDVQVTALHWQLRNGERSLVPTRSAASDDRGEYRIFGLNGGDYLISTEPPNFARGPAELVRIAEGEVDRALRGTTVGTTTSAVSRPFGPAPVFFPGTVRPSRAAMVTVAVGEERLGVDIRTELVPTARIGGSVIADGQPVAGIQVSLVALGPPAPNFSFAVGARLGPRLTDAKGQYTFVGVSPGEYRVQATTRPVGARGGASADPSPRMAFAMVEVDGTDHVIDLTLQPGMSVSGRFAFEGADQPASLESTQLTFEGARIGTNSQVINVRADASPDGTFRATGLTPGRFWLRAAGPRNSATSSWVLKSISANGRELLDSPFELAAGESLSGVVVTFTDRPNELTGAVQNSSGTPTTDYVIVVYTTDPQFWFPNSRRIVAVRPDSTGSYSIRNLPPGQYYLSALTDAETGEWFDPEFLRSLIATIPIKLTIGESERKRQDLRVGK